MLSLPVEIVGEPGLMDWLGVAVPALAIPMSIFGALWAAQHQARLDRQEKLLAGLGATAERLGDAAQVAEAAADTLYFISHWALTPDPEQTPDRFRQRWKAWIPTRIDGLVEALRALDGSTLAKAGLTMHQLTLISRLCWLRDEGGELLLQGPLDSDAEDLFGEVELSTRVATEAFRGARLAAEKASTQVR